MTAKHAPATPLPQIAVDRTRGNPVLYFAQNGTSPTQEQAAEIARRANAYPKLVEALSDLQFFVRLGTLSEQEAAVNRARILLRSLGEE